MINKIVSKLSNPFKVEDEICKSKERAIVIVEDMMVNISEYEMIDLESIDKEIKSIIAATQIDESISLEIIIDDSYGRINVSSSILQVILDLLNNSLTAFDDDSNRKEIKLQFIANEYGLEIGCCDNAKIQDPKIEKDRRDTALFVSREIIKTIFDGKMDPCSREYSRSEIYPADNSEKACFYIAIPYSSYCHLKEGYE